MKKLILCILSLPLLAAGCSGDGRSGQTASGTEAAKIEGRSYARLVINHNWTGDTMALHNKLLEVRARQSRYLLEGHREEAAAFDSAFLSTLRAVEPQLADKLTTSTLNADAK